MSQCTSTEIHSLRRPTTRRSWAPLWCLVCLLASVAGAHAATFVVDRTDDDVEASACTNAANDCSLRGAIIRANGDAVQDTITLPATQTYTLALGPADSTVGNINPYAGDLDITESLTINGNGSTVNGGGIDRVFSIGRYTDTNFIVTINNVIVRNGAPQGLFSFGGGINVRAATLNLNGCTVTANTTLESGVADNGGGIAVDGVLSGVRGTLNLSDCTVSGNTGYNGGGIVAGSASVAIARSTISGNIAYGTTGGGGIFVNGTSSSVQLINSTISGNSAAVDGGGILAYAGNLAISSNTITANAANRNGGGLCRLVGTTAVANTIVAGNNALQPDVAGAFSTSGSNLIGKIGTATGFTAASDKKGTVASPLDPMLGPLQNNGGPTFTHALLSGSPAVNTGNSPLAADQRGTARPQSTGDDIGAFELAVAGIFTISGRIADAEGTAIPGVAVTGGPGSPPVQTDSNGNYTLINAQNGVQTVTPTKASYTFTPISRSVTLNNGSAISQNFIGKIGINLIGRISTAGAVALPGVTVSRTGAASSVVTNAAGYYTFINVLPGTTTITPSLAGYFFTPTTRVVTAAAVDISNLNFAASPTHTLSGRVANSGGIGQPGVTVSRSGSFVTVVTNGAGYYTFTNVPDGTFTVTPSGAGFSFSPENRSVTLAGANVSNQNFTVAPGYNLSGRLMLSNGTGIVGATVSRSGSSATAVTNGAGYFTFTGVPAGSHVITPSFSGYTFTPVTKTVVITTADAVNQNFIGAPVP